MAPSLSTDVCAPLESALQAARQAPGSALLSYDAWVHLRHVLRLSDKELQIVEAVFDDKEPDIIARSLSISTDMVYRSLQRICVKLHIGSRVELVVRVMSEYLAFFSDQEYSEFGLSCWPAMDHPTAAGERLGAAVEKNRTAGSALKAS
jgi:DNA-binding CsgD family transcriptional regulator